MEKLTFNTYGNEKQKLGMRRLFDDMTNRVGYGGGAGGGKSYTGVAWQWMRRMKYPGTRGFFGRKELKRLKQTTLATYFQFLADYNIPEKQRGVYNSQDSIIRFENGSQIYLLDLAQQPSDPLYTRFGSLEFTDGFIDESAEVDEECIKILYTRIGRQKNDEYGLPPKMLETFNPDKGHVYRNYWLPFKAEKAEWDSGNWTIEHPGFNGEVVKRHWCFIPALATDNKKLARSYLDNLLSGDEVTRQRLLFGNFDYDDTPGRLFSYDAICDLWTNPRMLGEKYISCDAARKGKDSAVIIVWHGWHIVDIIIFAKCTNVELQNEIMKQCVLHEIPMRNVIVDEDGVGGGIVDNLRCKGFKNGSSPVSPKSATKVDYKKRNYENLKTQCYFLLAERVNASNMSIKPGLYEDKITQELDVVVELDLDKDGKKKIIKKEDVKMKLGRSPDFSDAIMMRMWFTLTVQGPDGETIQGTQEVVRRTEEPDGYGETPEEFEERMMSEVNEVSLNPY